MAQGFEYMAMLISILADRIVSPGLLYLLLATINIRQLLRSVNTIIALQSIPHSVVQYLILYSL